MRTFSNLKQTQKWAGRFLLHTLLIFTFTFSSWTPAFAQFAGGAGTGAAMPGVTGTVLNAIQSIGNNLKSADSTLVVGPTPDQEAGTNCLLLPPLSPYPPVGSRCEAPIDPQKISFYASMATLADKNANTYARFLPDKDGSTKLKSNEGVACLQGAIDNMELTKKESSANLEKLRSNLESERTKFERALQINYQKLNDQRALLTGKGIQQKDMEALVNSLTDKEGKACDAKVITSTALSNAAQGGLDGINHELMETDGYKENAKFDSTTFKLQVEQMIAQVKQKKLGTGLATSLSQDPKVRADSALGAAMINTVASAEKELATAVANFQKEYKEIPIPSVDSSSFSANLDNMRNLDSVSIGACMSGVGPYAARPEHHLVDQVWEQIKRMAQRAKDNPALYRKDLQAFTLIAGLQNNPAYSDPDKFLAAAQQLQNNYPNILTMPVETASETVANKNHSVFGWLKRLHDDCKKYHYEGYGDGSMIPAERIKKAQSELKQIRDMVSDHYVADTIRENVYQGKNIPLVSCDQKAYTILDHALQCGNMIDKCGKAIQKERQNIQKQSNQIAKEVVRSTDAFLAMMRANTQKIFNVLEQRANKLHQFSTRVDKPVMPDGLLTLPALDSSAKDYQVDALYSMDSIKKSFEQSFNKLQIMKDTSEKQITTAEEEITKKITAIKTAYPGQKTRWETLSTTCQNAVASVQGQIADSSKKAMEQRQKSLNDLQSAMTIINIACQDSASRVNPLCTGEEKKLMSSMPMLDKLAQTVLADYIRLCAQTQAADDQREGKGYEPYLDTKERRSDFIKKYCTNEKNRKDLIDELEDKIGTSMTWDTLQDDIKKVLEPEVLCDDFIKEALVLSPASGLTVAQLRDKYCKGDYVVASEKDALIGEIDPAKTKHTELADLYNKKSKVVCDDLEPLLVSYEDERESLATRSSYGGKDMGEQLINDCTALQNSTNRSEDWALDGGGTNVWDAGRRI